MVFFTPRPSHFIFYKFISLPARAPFNRLKSLLICVILLVLDGESVNGEIKTGNLTSGVWTDVTNRMVSTTSTTWIIGIISANRENLNTIPIISLTRKSIP